MGCGALDGHIYHLVWCRAPNYKALTRHSETRDGRDRGDPAAHTQPRQSRSGTWQTAAIAAALPRLLTPGARLHRIASSLHAAFEPRPDTGGREAQVNDTGSGVGGCLGFIMLAKSTP